MFLRREPVGDEEVSDGHGGSVGGVSSAFIQGVFIAVLTPAVAGLGYIYSSQVDKVNAMGIDMAKTQTLMSSMLELDKKIETDLSSISSKYIDEQINIQVIKGNEAEMNDSITRLKDDLAQSRLDRITDINDVRKRLEEVEKTIAPIHNGPDR